MIRNLIQLCHFLFLLILTVSCANNSNQIYTKISKKDFLDIIQDVEFAITENNFRIINRLHIGQSIRDRGTELFPKNEVILFCNLTLAEEMLKLKPDHINYCPYKITISEVNKNISIGTRLLPTNTQSYEINKFSVKINEILRKIVEYSASDDLFIFEKS
jgi:uncharacterized protein (DUF302 family)|tara:strand:- start:2393 stop:2872 length:480 start_codon:yes stop_codon:yes gene_type:complete